MKLSEIEALRDTLTVLPTAAGRREFYTLTPSAFERLLQEREMLLGGLKGLVGQLDGMRDFVIPDGGAESLVAAREAIEQAES